MSDIINAISYFNCYCLHVFISFHITSSFWDKIHHLIYQGWPDFFSRAKFEHSFFGAGLIIWKSAKQKNFKTICSLLMPIERRIRHFLKILALILFLKCFFQIAKRSKSRKNKLDSPMRPAGRTLATLILIISYIISSQKSCDSASLRFP